MRGLTWSPHRVRSVRERSWCGPMRCLIPPSCTLGKSLLFLYDLIFIGSVSVSRGAEVEVVMKRGRARETLSLQWSSLALRFDFFFLLPCMTVPLRSRVGGEMETVCFQGWTHARAGPASLTAAGPHGHTVSMLTTWACPSSSSLPVIDPMSSSCS